MNNVVDINQHRIGAAQAAPALASLDAEQALLGAVLMNNDVFRVVGSLIEPEHFTEAVHQRIWMLASDMISRGERADPITLRTHMGEADLGGSTPAQYLASLAAEATTIINAASYARHVRDLALRRRLAEIAEAAKNTALNAAETAPVAEMAKAIEDQVAEIRWSLDEPGNTREGSAGKLAAAVVAQARAIAEGRGVPAVRTGINSLDRRLPRGGLAEGGLYVLAGRTGMGKTLVGAAVSRLAAIGGHGVAYFSLEETAPEISARWLAASTRNGPSYGEIVKGECQDWFDELDDAANRLRELPLIVNDRPSMSVSEIALQAERYADRMSRQGRKLKLVVIDHAQIVRATDRYKSNRVGELGEIANEAKKLAKRLGVCVVLGSQLNRAVEGRDDKRPTMADLRASGEIEEAADCIMMLYRPAYYIARSPKARAGDEETLAELARVKDSIEIHIEKARQGETGMVELWCDPARSNIGTRWGQ